MRNLLFNMCNLKVVFLMFICSVILFLGSCDKNDVKHILDRDYAIDKAILEHYVDIDVTNVKYFINTDPEPEILVQIPETIKDELENVTKGNKNQYQIELDKINSLLEESIKTSDYIELGTKYKSVLFKINNGNTVSVEIKMNTITPPMGEAMVFKSSNKGGK